MLFMLSVNVRPYARFAGLFFVPAIPLLTPFGVTYTYPHSCENTVVAVRNVVSNRKRVFEKNRKDKLKKE